MKRSFDELVGYLKPTISGLDYFTNFERVYSNIDSIKVELNILNSLIGSKKVKDDFISIITRYPETTKCIPLLLAVRETEISYLDSGINHKIDFKKVDYSLDDYCNFMEKSGLFNLLGNRLVSNLSDYATGVEVGLDSNGRKARGGVLMSDLVEDFIRQIPNIEYKREADAKYIEKHFGFDILNHNLDQFEATKRFDFAIKSCGKLYLVEVNFFNGGGSKLNETARSFKEINYSISKFPNIHFIWITDGRGWIKHKNNLHEAFDAIENLLTIRDLELGKLKEIVLY